MYLRLMIRVLTILSIAGCLFLCQDGGVFAQEGGSGLVIVSGKALPQDSLSLSEAKKILLGETSAWRNGAKILIVMKPAGNADRTTVLSKVCGMTDTIFTRHQLQASFTGQSIASIDVAPSDAAVKATVKSNAGAIGFLHKKDVDESLKVLLVLE